MKYWTGGEYLGFGPSAASDFGGKRFTIMRDLKGYNEGIAKKLQVLTECESIPARERAGEYLMLRLRTNRGINGKEYEKRFLLPFEALEARLRKFQEHGYATEQNGNWRFTEAGWLLSNGLIVQLQEEQDRSKPISYNARQK
jgi:oxygen-independent coproporphyrinogen-3 oxidase